MQLRPARYVQRLTVHGLLEALAIPDPPERLQALDIALLLRNTTQCSESEEGGFFESGADQEQHAVIESSRTPPDSAHLLAAIQEPDQGAEWPSRDTSTASTAAISVPAPITRFDLVSGDTARRMTFDAVQDVYEMENHEVGPGNDVYWAILESLKPEHAPKNGLSNDAFALSKSSIWSTSHSLNWSLAMWMEILDGGRALSMKSGILRKLE